MSSVAQKMLGQAGKWSIALPASDRQQIEHIRDRCLAELRCSPWQGPNDRRFRGKIGSSEEGMLCEASALLTGRRRPSSLIQIKGFRERAELGALAGDRTVLEIYNRQAKQLDPLLEEPRRKKGGPH